AARDGRRQPILRVPRAGENRGCRRERAERSRQHGIRVAWRNAEFETVAHAAIGEGGHLRSGQEAVGIGIVEQLRIVVEMVLRAVERRRQGRPAVSIRAHAFATRKIAWYPRPTPWAGERSSASPPS